MSTDFSCRSRAVRALVILHEEQLRRFVETWRRASAQAVTLAASPDPAYESLETLCRHVLDAAGGYLVWTCEVLNLPNPGVVSAPPVETIASKADAHLEHVLERWRDGPLQDIADEQLETPEYQSQWRTRYCIDSMLEHAVMHPIRHTFQLKELMERQ